MLTRGPLPCANPEYGVSGAVKGAESRVRPEPLSPLPLTRYDAPLNASTSRCHCCAGAIPPNRIAAARRSKVEARWCSASCRVRGCVAKKRSAT